MRWLAVSVVVLSAFCDVLAEFPLPVAFTPALNRKSGILDEDLLALCDLPMEHGPGQDVIVLLHYDKAMDRCVPFRYGGLGGNENRFNTDRMCMRNCSSGAESLYPTDVREACHLRKQYGHCMSRYLLWYYDSVKEKCKTFHYTGCGGNGNRFNSEQLCNSTCSGITDEGDGEEDDSDTPVALIVGIVLGLLGAIIMIVTIVMVVMNKKPNNKEMTKKEKKEDGSPLQTKGIEMT